MGPGPGRTGIAGRFPRVRLLDSHIRAVTFDVGGTLIKSWPSVGHIYAEVAARHGCPGLSPETLTHRFAAAWWAQKGFNYTRAEWAALVAATFRGLADTAPGMEMFRELYRRFAEPGAWHVFEDVLPTLHALSALGLKLGVISNWDRRLGPLLRRLKLYGYFDAVVVSCNVGSAKPSPAIFGHAVKRLGVPPDAILHVGDNLEMDVHGARAAGLQALQICRGAKALRKGQIRSLRELYRGGGS